MKKIVVLALECAMLVTMLVGVAAAQSYDIIYLTPSTASTFWSQVEVGILQAKADLEKELAILRAKLPHVDDRLCVQVALAVKKLRDNEAILKKPSIAETLDWAAALDALGVRELTPDALRQTAGFVLKNPEDVRLIQSVSVESASDEHACGSDGHTCGCGGHCHA